MDYRLLMQVYRWSLCLVALLIMSGCHSASFPHETRQLTAWTPTSCEADTHLPPDATGGHEEPTGLPGEVSTDLSATDGSLLVLESTSGSEEVTACYLSSIIQSAFGIEEALLSWNVKATGESGAYFEIRVRDDHTRSWGPWLFLGEAGGLGHRAQEPRVQVGSRMKVDVDVLTDTSWFRDAQVRVELRASQGGKVEIKRVDLTRSLAFAKVAVQARQNAVLQPDWKKWNLPESVDLQVPFLSQATPEPALSGRLCSPASTAMAVAWAQEMSSQAASDAGLVYELAKRVRDPRHDIYGNWPRNVQGAFESGVGGKVIRFGSVVDVYRMLAGGGIVVASIMAKPGELSGAPYLETEGHLIVIKGYNQYGDFLVLDPAATDVEGGTRVYSKKDMAVVWLKNRRGTSYLFWKSGTKDPSAELNESSSWKKEPIEQKDVH